MMYYGLILQEGSPVTESGKYYFKLIALSKLELEEHVKDLGRVLRVTLLRTWELRSDPNGFLEDDNLGDSYYKRLNRGEISVEDLPERLR